MCADECVLILFLVFVLLLLVFSPTTHTGALFFLLSLCVAELVLVAEGLKYSLTLVAVCFFEI